MDLFILAKVHQNEGDGFHQLEGAKVKDWELDALFFFVVFGLSEVEFDIFVYEF